MYNINFGLSYFLFGKQITPNKYLSKFRLNSFLAGCKFLWRVLCSIYRLIGEPNPINQSFKQGRP